MAKYVLWGPFHWLMKVNVLRVFRAEWRSLCFYFSLRVWPWESYLNDLGYGCSSGPWTSRLYITCKQNFKLLCPTCWIQSPFLSTFLGVVVNLPCLLDLDSPCLWGFNYREDPPWILVALFQELVLCTKSKRKKKEKISWVLGFFNFSLVPDLPRCEQAATPTMPSPPWWTSNMSQNKTSLL